MKILNVNNPFAHILYWIFIVIILVLIFGKSWGDGTEAFYFISLLLPVIMATSYFFNYFLVPQYLLRRAYLKFGLFFFYTVVISLFLEMLVLTFTFIYLLEYDLGSMNPNASDTLLLAIIMYLVVFSGSFLLMAKQLNDNKLEILNLTEHKEKLETPFLSIVSQRKVVRIPFENILFVESYSDYIKINTITQGEIVSKERISNIKKELPDNFLRIHRSYIVNTNQISQFDYNAVELNGQWLNIGRTYKKEALNRLKGATFKSEPLQAIK